MDYEKDYIVITYQTSYDIYDKRMVKKVFRNTLNNRVAVYALKWYFEDWIEVEFVNTTKLPKIFPNIDSLEELEKRWKIYLKDLDLNQFAKSVFDRDISVLIRWERGLIELCFNNKWS